MYSLEFDEEKISKYFTGIVSIDLYDYEESLSNLEDLNNFESEHYRYGYLYLESLINSGNYNDAIKYTKKLQQKGLQNFESNLFLALSYIKNSEFNKLNTLVTNNFFNNSPTTPTRKMIFDSIVAWGKIIQDKANNDIDKTFDLESASTGIKKIQTALAHCYANSTKTTEKFEELINDTDNQYARYNFFLADYYINNKNPRKAIAITENALDKNPGNLLLLQLILDLKTKNINSNNTYDCTNVSHNIAELLYIFANAFSSQEIYSMSNFYLGLVKFLNPNFVSYNILLYENLLKNKKYEVALNLLNEVAQAGEIYHWYSVKQKAKIYDERSMQQTGLKLIKQEYDKIASPSVYQTFDYAEYLKNSKNFEEAIKYYSIILNQIDTNHLLYALVTDGRGSSYERVAEYEKSEVDLLNSLKKKPDQPYVMNYLAYTWLELGKNIPQALELLEKANRLRPNDPYIIDSLGWGYYKQNRVEDSLPLIKQAFTLLPTDPTIADHLGDIMWRLGRKLEARYYWEFVVNAEDVEQKVLETAKEKIIFGL